MATHQVGALEEKGDGDYNHPICRKFTAVLYGL